MKIMGFYTESKPYTISRSRLINSSHIEKIDWIMYNRTNAAWNVYADWAIQLT